MPKLTSLLTLCLLSFFAIAQEHTIHNTNLGFDMPNKKWDVTSDQDMNDLHLLTFKREPIMDDSGMNVIPNISFITENVGDSADVVVFSASKRIKMPINVIDVFTYETEGSPIKYPNSIGYLGTYEENSIEHAVYIIHMINGETGIQLIMDITSNLFDEYKDEFQLVISSIEEM